MDYGCVIYTEVMISYVIIIQYFNMVLKLQLIHDNDMCACLVIFEH